MLIVCPPARGGWLCIIRLLPGIVSRLGRILSHGTELLARKSGPIAARSGHHTRDGRPTAPETSRHFGQPTTRHRRVGIERRRAAAGTYLRRQKQEGPSKSRRTGDFAIASVAPQMVVDRGGVCRSVGIGLGGVGTTPVKAEAVERFISGKTLSQELIDQAAQLVSTEVAPYPTCADRKHTRKGCRNCTRLRALYNDAKVIRVG